MMKTLKKTQCQAVLLSTVLLAVLLAAPVPAMAAQPTVNLGTTASFAVLAGSTITNTGPTTINGDVGVHPGNTFTGQSSATINGAVHLADGVALQAKNDLVTAYNDAAGRTPVTRIATELGGNTLLPGVYDSASGTFQITGTLTLDAQGDPNAVFIFQTATTLVTAANSNISLLNGARFCRIFWKVGSSATLGVGSHFVGHIFALTSITANTGATVQGQLLARNGAVTLDTNTITNGLCPTLTTTTTANGTTTTTGNGTTTTTGNGTTTTGTGTTTTTGNGTTTTTGNGTTTTGTGTTTTTGTGTTTTTGTGTTTTTGIGTTTTRIGTTTTRIGTTTTGTGGKLPKTSSPWPNVLLVGAFLALFGAVGSLRHTRKTHG
jgi:hypothetical protein